MIEHTRLIEEPRDIEVKKIACRRELCLSRFPYIEKGAQEPYRQLIILQWHPSQRLVVVSQSLPFYSPFLELTSLVSHKKKDIMIYKIKYFAKLS